VVSQLPMTQKLNRQLLKRTTQMRRCRFTLLYSPKGKLNGENVALVATADAISDEELEAVQSSKKERLDEVFHEKNHD